jgi:hypothetical protein
MILLYIFSFIFPLLLCSLTTTSKSTQKPSLSAFFPILSLLNGGRLNDLDFNFTQHIIFNSHVFWQQKRERESEKGNNKMTFSAGERERERQSSTSQPKLDKEKRKKNKNFSKYEQKTMRCDVTSV